MRWYDHYVANMLFSYRWAVENQIGKKDLVIDDCDAKQGVYIYGCKDSVLQIKGTWIYFYYNSLNYRFQAWNYWGFCVQLAGKVNIITIDKCTKMGVVFTVSNNMEQFVFNHFKGSLWIRVRSYFLVLFLCKIQDVVAACEIVNCNGVEVQCQVET